MKTLEDAVLEIEKLKGMIASIENRMVFAELVSKIDARLCSNCGVGYPYDEDAPDRCYKCGCRFI